MAEFVVIGLSISTVAILWISRTRMMEDRASGIEIVLTFVLLTSWLPALFWGVHDLPPSFDWREEIFTPVSLLILAPFVGSWAWCRRARIRFGWRVLLAPVGIYLFVTAQLVLLLMSLQLSGPQRDR
jgi:hypothetical protein